jgi:hypothetical protein
LQSEVAIFFCVAQFDTCCFNLAYQIWEEHTLEVMWDASHANEETAPQYVADFLNGRRKRVVYHLVGAVGAVVSAVDREAATPQQLVNVWSESQRGEAFGTFQRTLREFVDEWINSGRAETVGECPWDRKPSLMAREKVRRFWDNNRVRVMINEEGKLQLRPGITRDFVNLRLRAEDYATLWFSRLMDSESSRRLFRCEHCKAYFVRNNAPRKGIAIKRGTFCESCRNTGGLRRNTDRRGFIQRERLNAAATWLPKYTKTNRDGPLKEWLAKKLNEAMEAKGIRADPITSLWVARYWHEIEALSKKGGT